MLCKYWFSTFAQNMYMLQGEKSPNRHKRTALSIDPRQRTIIFTLNHLILLNVKKPYIACLRHAYQHHDQTQYTTAVLKCFWSSQTNIKLTIIYVVIHIYLGRYLKNVIIVTVFKYPSLNIQNNNDSTEQYLAYTHHFELSITLIFDNACLPVVNNLKTTIILL